MAEVEVGGVAIAMDESDAAHVQMLHDNGFRLRLLTSYTNTAGKRVNYVALFLKGRYQRLLGRQLLNAPDNLVVDYINGDPLDMRRANMRLCTRAEDLRNRKPNAGHKFIGVQLDHHGRWRARIVHDGERIALGHYDAPEDAARAYDEAARRLHGAFARLNFQNESTEGGENG